MVTNIGAPIFGRQPWKQIVARGLNGFLIWVVILVSGCSTMPPPEKTATLTNTVKFDPTSTVSITPTQTTSVTTTPTQTATLKAVTSLPRPDLQGELNKYLTNPATGQWGVFIENLNTGESASYKASEPLHPASTVKTYLAVAMLYWLEKNPNVSITDKPKWDTTHTYQEILQAALGGTDEILTGEMYQFLINQPGFSPLALAKTWGAVKTTFGPRQSTPADLGLLLKKLNQKEILSDKSRQILFSILQPGDKKANSLLTESIPEPERAHLIEKSSMVFTESVNVMATTALFVRPDCAYTITILANKVEPLNKNQADIIFKNISKSAFYAYCGLAPGEVLPTATLEPSPTVTPILTSTPMPTETPIPPTPTETVTPTLKVTLTPTLDTPLTRDVVQLMNQIPNGVSGAYIKNFKTGELVSIRGNDTFHIASSIKIFVGIAFFAWLDKHPEVTLSNVPDWDNRSYGDLLNAMLVESDEVVTAEFYNMLSNYQGFNPSVLARSWGAVHTEIGNRQSTPADVSLMFEKLDKHEILSDKSRQKLLSIMRTISTEREIPALVKGLPEAERPFFADKNGLVFEDELNVIADAGYFVKDTCSFSVVVVTNRIDPANKAKINDVISSLAATAYSTFCH